MKYKLKINVEVEGSWEQASAVLVGILDKVKDWVSHLDDHKIECVIEKILSAGEGMQE